MERYGNSFSFESHGISERAYNLIIGFMLLWGFGLNYVMATFFSEPILCFIESMNPIAFLIGYVVCVLIGTLLIHKTGSVGSFIGYTLIAMPIGILLCAFVDGIAVDTIRSAVFVTAIVTLTFMILGTLFPKFFLKLGRVLLFALIGLIIGELLSTLIFRYYSGVYDWLAVGVFSLYVGFDWAKANSLECTVNNAIDSAAELYLDIINLFIRILSIMARSKSRD